LMARLAILSATIGALCPLQRAADQCPLELIAERCALRARSAGAPAAPRSPAQRNRAPARNWRK
jgi:hypothetical protein